MQICHPVATATTSASDAIFLPVSSSAGNVFLCCHCRMQYFKPPQNNIIPTGCYFIKRNPLQNFLIQSQNLVQYVSCTINILNMFEIQMLPSNTFKFRRERNLKDSLIYHTLSDLQIDFIRLFSPKFNVNKINFGGRIMPNFA